ncbi:polysaccharide deacetylase family protein [Thalassospira tepidiphila]|uniref:polysaccharide deacetylase family protein n=1 Tax=Thalassospira tepidiphila TaxID=393657 RepID=UPI003AA7C6E3
MISASLSKDNLLILLFHGVVRENKYLMRNYIRKHIEEDFFIALLSDLKEQGPCLSMDEVYELCKSGRTWPCNAFAITFDDGFENNYSIAAPVLKELSLPATFYVTSNFIQSNSMSWTDQAEFMIEKSVGSRRELTLPWLPSLTFNLSCPENAIKFMSSLRSYIFENDNSDPQEVVSWLSTELAVPVPTTSNDPLDKKMSWEQVAELHRSPLFTIGGHTHTHPIMSHLSQQQLDHEIDTNLELLRTKSGVETVHFAYPQGQQNHYSERVVTALKRKGILCCPTAIDGLNSVGMDPFHLRRYLVNDHWPTTSGTR